MFEKHVDRRSDGPSTRRLDGYPSDTHSRSPHRGCHCRCLGFPRAQVNHPGPLRLSAPNPLAPAFSAVSLCLSARLAPPHVSIASCSRRMRARSGSAGVGRARLPRDCYMGANYLDACRRGIATSDESAQAALDLVESVLHGRRDEGTVDYAWRGGEDRWFEMRVQHLVGPEGARPPCTSTSASGSGPRPKRGAIWTRSRTWTASPPWLSWPLPSPTS